jgi:APA family basic amino acid/polyamine antiporter
MKPSVMASLLGSPILLLSVWIVAGLITLFGALSNAEAAAMFPETGGQFVFFRKMYGETFAFVYGWASFAVFNTAGNASIAYVCAQYTGGFVRLPQFPPDTEHSLIIHLPGIGNIFPLENIGTKSLTLVIVIALSLLNCRSTLMGGALQRLLTALKAGAMLLIISGLFFSGKGSLQNISGEMSAKPEGWMLFTGYVAAISGAFSAYDGWNNITFVAGEIKEPRRNIPRSLLLGLSFCVVIYFLITLAYVTVLPIRDVAGSPVIATDVATVAFGPAGAIIIGLMVILSTFGTANANILSTSRVTFVMAENNRFFSFAGKVHEKYGTPANALLLNAGWSGILIFTGSFDVLTDMLIFVSWFFYGMSALGIFVLRKKMKEYDRPYKVWGYPVVPFIFVLFTLIFLVATVYKDIRNYDAGQQPIVNSVLGMIIVLAGIPVYYSGRKKSI